MTIAELQENISSMFPQDTLRKSGSKDSNYEELKRKSDKEYDFYISEIIELIRGHQDYESLWGAITDYDGNTKRPKLSFFKKAAAMATGMASIGYHYYKCECGELLSESSEGGCPSCRSASKTEHRYAKAPVNVTVCQSACFDCSIYTDFVMCAGCKDFGTPAYLDCKDKSKCKGRTCCKFEYMRTYKPKELKPDYQKALRSLPPTISEAGKMFQAGTVSPVDIKGYLKRNEA